MTYSRHYIIVLLGSFCLGMNWSVKSPVARNQDGGVIHKWNEEIPMAILESTLCIAWHKLCENRDSFIKPDVKSMNILFFLPLIRSCVYLSGAMYM